MASKLRDNMQLTLAGQSGHTAKAKHKKQRIPIFPSINKHAITPRAQVTGSRSVIPVSVSSAN